MEVTYENIYLGTIRLGKNGCRLGIKRIAQKMRECFPRLRNFEIAKFLEIDQGTLARYIGSSPANYKKCTGCGKCLKVERKASYSRQTGICSECRQKARRLKGNGSEKFCCLNCLGKFERKHWEVRTRIKRSKRASPPIFCGNKCHNEYRRSHHIKGRQPCQF